MQLAGFGQPGLGPGAVQWGGWSRARKVHPAYRPPPFPTDGVGEYYSAPGAGGVRQLHGMGEYFSPAGVRRNYGAQEAQRAAPIMPGDQSANQTRAICPKAVSSSIFGGRVPGGTTIGRSIFSMPVYENGGNVPERMSVEPRDLAVNATNAEAAVRACAGVGPDGLGASPAEYRSRYGVDNPTARQFGRRARVRARMGMPSGTVPGGPSAAFMFNPKPEPPVGA